MVSMDSNEEASDQRPESFLVSFITNWIHSGRQVSLIDLVDDAILESRSKIRNQLSRLPNESLIIHELDQASESSVLTLSKIASLLEDATKHFDNIENELIPLLNTVGKELRDQVRIEEGIKSMKGAKDSLNYKRIPSYDDFSHLEEDEIDNMALGGVRMSKDSKAPKEFETPTDSNAISNQSLVGKTKSRRSSIPDVSDSPECRSSIPDVSDSPDCETSHLLSSRKIISQDLMEQFPVGSDADADQDGDADKVEGNQDGANREDAPFSFAFPRCQVSKSALALIDLVMQILDEAEMIIFNEDANNEDANKDANNEDANRDANNEDANREANNEDAKSDPEKCSDAEKSEDGASGGNKDTIPAKEKALKLYITASKVIRLYQIMTPVKNKKLIKNSLTASALFHNNCLFMAHFLLTSPQIQDAPAQIKDSKISGANSSEANSFGAKSLSRPGFNQIASLLEDQGRQVIQEAMREEKYKFIEFYNNSSVLTSLIENATLSDDLKPFEFAAKKSIYLLNAICNSWKEILPIGVYNHLIGNLISFIFDEIITKILSIEDISASSANKMSQIMKYFQKESFETALRTETKSEANLKDANKTDANLFNTQVPSSFKFNELRNALTASLADIVNRWGDGYGPLSMAFTDVQVKKLIRALFQNSEIRAVALSRIRNAEQN